ncbi:MAG: hypothetical protein INR71_06090 [Terriglobus roseus]|nr:hypothetical protein [Terriglobus roseus]
MPCAIELIRVAQDIVVRLMESCGDSYRNTTSNKETILFASERAIGDYLSICHLLASIAACSPDVKAAVDQKLVSFIDDPPKRHKQFTPNLGELLVLLAATENVQPMALIRPLLREALTRGVVWSIDPVQGRGFGGLALLEKDPVCEWRLASTFEAQKTSLRLLCFQLTFYRKVAALRDEGRLDIGLNARYGLAPPSLATELVRSIRSIFALDNFASFSKFLCVAGHPRWDCEC